MGQSNNSELFAVITVQKLEIKELVSSLNLMAFARMAIAGAIEDDLDDLFYSLNYVQEGHTHFLMEKMIDEIISLMPLTMRIFPLVREEVYELLEPNVIAARKTSG